MAAFLVLVVAGGYLAAALVFMPLFLLYTARARPRTAVVYTLVLGIVLLSLPSLLPGRPAQGLLPVTRHRDTAPLRTRKEHR